MDPIRPNGSWRRPAAEIAAAAILLIWRICSRPLGELWRDWIVLLSLYWVFTVLGSKSRAWPAVTVLLTIALLGIYASGQLPKAIDTLRYAW